MKSTVRLFSWIFLSMAILLGIHSVYELECMKSRYPYMTDREVFLKFPKEYMFLGISFTVGVVAFFGIQYGRKEKGRR